MIEDSDSNFLYLADCLPKLQPVFYNRLIKVLCDLQIPFDLLPYTKDIWAKDFMPLQIEKSEYVQFIYDPDYLKPPEYHHLLTNPDGVCNAIYLNTKKSKVKLDGGNVIRTKDKILICDKVFIENPRISKLEIVEEFTLLFKTDKIIFIPWDRNDFTGHSDGMVRFVNDNTVVINEPTNENTHFEKRLRSSLKDAGLEVIEIPYIAPNDPTYISAKGLHLNFLEMNQAVIVPVFNQATDDKSVRILENIFKGRRVVTIDCNEIASEGGVLNCISWNIVK